MIFMLIFTNILIVYLCIRLYKAFFAKNSFLIVVPILFILAFSFVIMRVISNFTDIRIPEFLLETSYIIIGIYVYLIILFVLFDLSRLLPPVKKFYKKYSRKIDATLVIGAFALFGYGFYNQGRTVVEKYDITFEKSLKKPLKIAAISDIHIGSGFSLDRLQENVDRINALNPDIILVVGDIIDKDVKDFTEDYRKVLRSLDAPQGVYAVFGNHEYYSGDPTEVAELLQDAGMRVLFNQVEYFDDHGFYLLGRDSLRHSAIYGNNRVPAEQLVQLIEDKTKPLIIMDHIPRSTQDGKTMDAMLQISGHTHDGQFAPLNFIVKAMYPISHGLLKDDNFNLLVSSGLGLWGPPMRVGTQSEIVEINVK